jgi:predicted RNA binding protein YcfA (HicA-like mRNA interferase family)
MSDKPKKYFSAMREGVAEKLAQRHQELRKKSGLPHPDYYKEFGKSYDIKDDSERMAHQSSLKKKYGVKEEVEPLDELSTDTLKSYIGKSTKDMLERKRQQKIETDRANLRTKHEMAKKRGLEAADRIGASAIKRAAGIGKASMKIAMKKEEVEMLDEMPESSMKTRDVHAHLKKSGWSLARTGGGHDVYSHPKSKQHIAVPRHKQLKAPLIRGIMKASRVSEEIEIDEQLEKKGRFVSGPIKKPFKSNTVVSSIKEAKDPREYDYEGDMAMSQLRSLVFNAEDMMDLMDENTNLPEWVQSKITLAEDYISTAANYLRGELTEEVKRYVPSPHATPAPKKPKGEYERKVDKYLKKKYQKEELELQEGRPSQRHPLEGHEYHKKSDEALIHIAKDAHEAAEAMKGHNTQAENKYRDQANDSATVRHFRKKSGMPDWYKKKYGHVKEEVEQLDEKNVPTSPEKWAQAKAQAKSKFDVYPSAYANGWAAKKYKEMGGGWKSVNEETSDEPSMAARTLSRKAQIVRDTAKSRKDEKDEASDKFQKEPELSSDIQKAP